MEIKLDPRIPTDVPLFVGDWHNKLMNQVAAVARYQWKNNIKDGIRGYIFYGSPGTGNVGIAAAASLIAIRTAISPICTPPIIGAPFTYNGIFTSSSAIRLTF